MYLRNFNGMDGGGVSEKRLRYTLRVAAESTSLLSSLVAASSSTLRVTMVRMTESSTIDKIVKPKNQRLPLPP